MAEWVKVKGWQGFELEAYQALPSGPARGALIVLHEIFGVNAYVRDRADFYARQGYAVLAPRFWDRIERGVELEYTREDARHARDAFSLVLDRDLAVRDLGCVAESMAGHGRVGLVGYSWGATTSWVASSRLGPACAVGYYAGTRRYSRAAPQCPVMLHLAQHDRRLVPEDIEFLAGEHPSVTVHLYAADHGFDCPDPRRRVHDPVAADIARGRTLAFLAEHVG